MILKNYLHYKKIVDEEVSKHIVEKTFKERKENNANTGKFRSIGLSSQSKLF